MPEEILYNENGWRLRYIGPPNTIGRYLYIYHCQNLCIFSDKCCYNCKKVMPKELTDIVYMLISLEDIRFR